jgi:hypothetical protein
VAPNFRNRISMECNKKSGHAGNGPPFFPVGGARVGGFIFQVVFGVEGGLGHVQ